MLIQFSVENFLSFKEKQIFSMLATKDESHPEHIVPVSDGVRKPLLRTAALYGANASGKSNLIKAMKFAQNLVVEGTDAHHQILITPFKLCAPSDEPSKFQFIFSWKGIEYTYGFSLTPSQILEEYLYATAIGERMYFERITNTEGITEAKLGPSLSSGKKGLKQYFKYKVADTRSND